MGSPAEDRDAERFAPIDALRVVPNSARMSDKRTLVGSKRYVRPAGTGFTVRAACGCGRNALLVTILGGTCPVCGGAELTIEEHTR